MTPQQPSPPAAPRRGAPDVAPVVGALVAFLALVLLAAAPLAISRRLTTVRQDLVLAPERARALVREVETATLVEALERRDAMRLAMRHAMRDLTAPLELRYAQAIRTEAARDSELAAAQARLDAPTSASIAALRAAVARWRATRSIRDATADSITALRLTDVLRATTAADMRIAAAVGAGRTRIVALERLETLLPVTLVPVVLLALGAVAWAARRMARLAREAERARGELARSAEARIALLRGLTHDLKNSLWAAAGYASILHEDMLGPLTSEQREKVARIGRLIDMSQRMVADTLEIARADAGLLPVRRRRTDLRAMLLAAAADYRGVVDTAGLTLHLELDEQLPTIETDETHVGTIVANLLSNAIKYTPRGGRVCLRGVRRPQRVGAGHGRWVVVQVSDTGPGIPPAFHERIFEEFFRLPAAQATASGAGVGLAMSRRVARLLGGDILVTSSAGQGSEFSLWLPADADVAAVAAPAPGPTVPGMPGMHGGRSRPAAQVT